MSGLRGTNYNLVSPEKEAIEEEMRQEEKIDQLAVEEREAKIFWDKEQDVLASGMTATEAYDFLEKFEEKPFNSTVLDVWVDPDSREYFVSRSINSGPRV